MVYKQHTLFHVLPIFFFTNVKSTGPLKKVISLRNISKVFSHFFKYINGLSFTIHVINLSCNFASINHINV